MLFIISANHIFQSTPTRASSSPPSAAPAYFSAPPLIPSTHYTSLSSPSLNLRFYPLVSLFYALFPSQAFKQSSSLPPFVPTIVSFPPNLIEILKTLTSSRSSKYRIVSHSLFLSLSLSLPILAVFTCHFPTYLTQTSVVLFLFQILHTSRKYPQFTLTLACSLSLTPRFPYPI